ncbi:MAG: hypothetical protein DRH57_07420 [Candidatus Cloacimonadota bacterium]|nr:MAG: hypothetical protein DRH57_07420 [Candidatus Cloacimonadota bacterium]
MAKKIVKRKVKEKRLVFESINIIFFILALLFLIVGYVIVNSSTNLGTILLFLGYTVLIPASLLVKSKRRIEKNQGKERRA